MPSIQLICLLGMNFISPFFAFFYCGNLATTASFIQLTYWFVSELFIRVDKKREMRGDTPDPYIMYGIAAMLLLPIFWRLLFADLGILVFDTFGYTLLVLPFS